MKKIKIIFSPGTKINILANRVKNGFMVLKNEGIESFVTKSIGILCKRYVSNTIKFSNTYRPLNFPKFDKPIISIIIPTYNQHIYTYNCLLSIFNNKTSPEYEVIIVDNASTDETLLMLSIMKNIKIIKNEENYGFVDACNIGACASKGKFIYFLNNDTIVTENAISNLVNTFDNHPSAGAAGSKLIYPNFTLQEAGGIIWKDASAWNYGKFEDPEKPEYNYVREVDYCSGASLCLRKDLFEKIGGFDSRYAPAYWEDSDLCFSVRQIGYKVFYQPASIIIHFEGATAGTNTSSGMKKYQEVNKPKFINKWSAELANQFENKQENIFKAKDRNRGKMFLVIDQRVPEHDKDAGSFFTYSLLGALIHFGYRVVFWPHQLARIEPYTSELQQMGIEVIYGAVNFKKFIERNGKYFDCAILSRNHISIHYIDLVKKRIPKIIYHDPDFEYIREKRRMELEGVINNSLEKIKNRELYLFQQCDVITTVNEDEANLMRFEMPYKEVVVVPHPIKKIFTMNTPFEERENLIFVGSSHPPNTDAILYYAKEIMPILKEKIPYIKLVVVGENHSSRLKELRGSGDILFTGFVKDLLPYFEKSRVYIAPMRYGAGVKGKVIEAMSYGLPVVTTSVGAEGLGCVNLKHLFIADNKYEIAEAIITLYFNKSLWEKLSECSRRLVSDNYSQENFRKAIEKITKKI